MSHSRYSLFGAQRIRPLGHSTVPAAPTPTASTSGFFSRNASVIRSSSADIVAESDDSGVGSVSSATTVPSSATTAPATLVPPMSSPIACLATSA